MPELYLKRGTMATKDLNTLILAGSALGGGTLVNWTTSFRAPADVLEEWSRLSGLRLFTEDALQASYTAVEQRIQVNTENSVHNRQNQLLFEGAQRLGYYAGSLPRNAVGCEQRCGTCGFGCRYGCKQSTTKTYLQDAFDRGARILVHCSADRVLIENGRVVGVEATAYDPATA
jgi:choline dehydrogenase-like flavoprotein